MRIINRGREVPFINPKFNLFDMLPIAKSIKSTWLVYGKNTRTLEQELREYLNVADVVATSSCTTALQLALMLAGIEPGDEVITTPMSWVATTTAIIHQGGVPVFCDVDNSGLIDVSKIEPLLTEKTRAILFVDLYGQMPDVFKLKNIATTHGLVLIEDAAHALEARYVNERPGSISDYAAFSFHAAKNITSGQGGALTVPNQEIGKLARILRRDGVINLEDGRRRMIHLGNKFDSTDFQSVMLLKQLRKIDRTQNKRKKIFEYYLSNIDAMRCDFPIISQNAHHAHHLFTVLVNPEKRDQIRAYMGERGISTSIHYESINLEPYFQDKPVRNSENLANSERFGRSVISLPTYHQITKRQLRRVVRVLNEAMQSVEN